MLVWYSWSAKEGEDVVASDVVATVEGQYTKLRTGGGARYWSEHQNEREELGVSSVSEGHANGAEGNRRTRR